MSHPEDNSAFLSAADEIRDYEYKRGTADSQAKVTELSVALSAERAKVSNLTALVDLRTAERDAARDEFAEHMKTHPAPVDPKAALRDAWGVCVHPSFQKKPAWQNPDQWMAEVDAIGFGSIRGMWAPQLENCRRTLDLCRQYDVKWLMLLSPEDWSVTPAEAEAKIKWLADNDYLDVVLGFENANEPEAGDNVPADWAQRTVNMAKAIKAARDKYAPGKIILSPSMHDVAEDNSNGAGYKALAALGIAQYVDRVSLHSYPKGQTVLTGFDPRWELAKIAYPADMPVWLTEVGWTTYLRRSDGPRGPQPTTEADAAKFGAEAPGIIAEHPVIEKAFRYEGRDDPVADMSKLTNPERGETRYGVVRDDGSWKPEATDLQKVLTG